MNDEVDDETPLLLEISEDYEIAAKRSRVSSKLVIGIIATVCIVSLALGLGLGLGLRKSSSSVDNVCPKFSRSRQSKSRPSSSPRSTGSRWLQQECSIPNDQKCPEKDGPPQLILISLDGFRAEYLTRNHTPVLRKLAECGSWTPAMRPVYPSKTFPNHYAIVTGLYSESHGIIDNLMYDKSLKQTFTLAGEEKNDPRWWHGEPVWNTALKNGLKAATMFWPGSEAPIQGIRPSFCFEFDSSIPFEDRVDEVLAWMDMSPKERPDFITLYLNQPDSAGHEYGPFHAKLNSNLTHVDQVIGQLMDGLLDRGVDKCTNVVVLADHGMAPVDCHGRNVMVKDLIDPTKLFFHNGVLGRVTGDYRLDSEGNIVEQDNGESPQQILDHLKCGSYNNTKDWYTRAQHKYDLPVRLHYQRSPRIEDVIVTVEEEWQISANPLSYCSVGDHGYDNKYDSMQALFLAYGPSIKENTQVEPFENIEVYNFLTELLHIEGAVNNGTKGALSDLLRTPQALTPPPSGVSYGNCPYPDSNDVIESRRNSSTCRCQGLVDPDPMDKRLDLSNEVISDLEKQHLPLGVPTVGEGNLCRLAQNDYVTGYNKNIKMPAWSAFNLNTISGSPTELDGSCVRRDVRLANDEAADCSDFHDDDVTWAFMFPSELSSPGDSAYDAHISSNLVPMYNGFKNGVWQYVIELLREYREKYGNIHVTAGPVFDHNHDGLADAFSAKSKIHAAAHLDIPDYYFVTLLRCDSGNVTHCSEKLQTMSVLVPHKPSLDYCQTFENSAYFTYLAEHVARVRDIEHLTGLTFYKNLPEVQRAKVITHMEFGLWKRKSWIDQETCPDVSTPSCPPGYDPAHLPLLLISLDGFRHDYLHRNLTPTLQKMSSCGVSTPYMRSVYPTLTFPNHYSLVTGLYPDFHGIVDNSMFDMTLDMPFFLGSPNTFNSSWWGGEPIWNTVEKAGKKAVTMFWPGSDVPIQGMHPTDYYLYNGDIPYNFRVDQILKWLNGSAGVIPDLLVLYMDKIDKGGHDGGPNSVQVDEALRYVDKQISDLMDGIQRAGFGSCLNILVTSDHGMTDLSCDRTVLLRDYLNNDELADKMYAYAGGAGRIGTKYTRSGNDYFPIPQEERVSPDNIVKDVECKSENLAVYLNKDFPVRFHYASNPRTEQVQLKLKDTWQVDRFSPWCGILGQHSWDPNYDTMKAFFVALGPAFKDQYQTEAFESIELNNLMSRLLDVTPPLNNGTEGSLYDILRTTPAVPPLGPSVDYEECPFPSDSDGYFQRANMTDCSCSLSPEETQAADDRLNLNPDDREAVLKLHIPQGAPLLVNQTGQNPFTQKVCILAHEDYITGFSHELKMPLWTSYTLNTEQVDLIIKIPDCLRPDVRVDPENLPTCQDMENLGNEYVYEHLFPLHLASHNESVIDAGLLSNAVPMLKKFVNDVWNKVINQMRKWTRLYKDVHIQVGPVFDYDSDGVADSVEAIQRSIVNSSVAIPSHFYLSVLWCDKPSCTNMDYNVNSFIIPHRPVIHNCMSFEDYMYDNRVRLRDIELITNLQMLTANHTLEAVRVRTRMPQDLSSLS